MVFHNSKIQRVNDVNILFNLNEIHKNSFEHVFSLCFCFSLIFVYKVLDLGSLFGRYPSYNQRPYYGSSGYPGGYGGFNNQGGMFPGANGYGTNVLGNFHCDFTE